MHRVPVLLLAPLPIALAAALAVIPADAQRRQTSPKPGAAADVKAESAPAQGALSARNANYSIDVTLDRGRRRLGGREILTWRNTSHIATSELRFHLYYNAWKNTSSTFLREAGRVGWIPERRDLRPADMGWIDVTSMRLIPGSAPPVDLTAGRRFVAPDDGNPDDQTVMAVPLPSPVASRRDGERRDSSGPRRSRARSRAPAPSATTSSSRSGSRRSACSRTPAGTATSSTRAPSSSRTTASTTSG